MADQFLPALLNLKHSFSLSDINFDFTNQFPGINNTPIPHQIMGFQQDNFVFTDQCPENLQALFTPHNTLASPFTKNEISYETDCKDRKRKAFDTCTPETSSAYSSPQASDDGMSKNSRRGKRVKGNGKDTGKPLDVVHVRARRGQATDSHSLAERARRGKINERLKCLQEIVPGCYKTMGMAVMLDEIINYVQSLQNQVEFLSMRLSAASSFTDVNSSEALMLETLQRAKAIEELKIQNLAGQGVPSAQFTPLGLNFGYFPQLPNNR